MDYQDLPPFGTVGAPELPSTPAPTEQATAPVDEDVTDVDDFDVGPDEGTDQEPDVDEDGQVADDDTDDEDGGDDVEALRERLRKAEEREAELLEYQKRDEQARLQQQQREAEAYWTNAKADAVKWYQGRKAAIYREAENSMSPIGYIAENMRLLDAQYDHWNNQFHARREQSAWQFAMKQALPNYAAEVAEYYGLGRDVIPELLEYPPDMIPKAAERLKVYRDQLAAERRRATQAERKKQRQEKINEGVGTGDGRVAASDVPLDSDEYYNSIPWQRVAPR